MKGRSELISQAGPSAALGFLRVQEGAVVRACCACSLYGWQVKPLRDEVMVATSDARGARKETAEAVAALGALRGEILVLQEQLAEFEKERIRQREHYDR